MTSTLVSTITALPGWNLSMLVLLAKATLILVAALGTTLAMQRFSAGARHLVWLATLGMLLLVPALTAWGPLQLRILPRQGSRLEACESHAGIRRFAQPEKYDTGQNNLRCLSRPEIHLHGMPQLAAGAELKIQLGSHLNRARDSVGIFATTPKAELAGLVSGAAKRG